MWPERVPVRFQEAVSNTMKEPIDESDPIQRLQAYLKWCPLVNKLEENEAIWLLNRMEKDAGL